MLLTEQQLYQIRQIVMDHHMAFVVNTIGPNAVAPEVLQGLKDKGLVNVKVSSIEDSYLYGQILAMMDDPKFATMTYEQFKQYIQKNPVPLSPIEQQAVQFAQHQAANYCKGLGNRVDVATGQILIEADAALRQKMRDTIRTKTAENIEKRQSLKKLKSELGWATRDWARDWERIANTEKQNAMQRGVADHYAKRYGGDVRVAKRPMPDACKHCKRLHIGPDGHPRIFKLSELEANGTNVGRKASDWLPVVGTVHPHCQCQMIRIPEGWGFNDDGSLAPGGEYGIEYQSEEELKLAMLQEMDLQKAFQIQKRITYQGIPIAIENTVGSVRKWKDGMGGEGETVMQHAYGYIERTTGADEDEIDVFVGPDPKAKQAYIIHQRNVHTDVYDEDKVMLGFSNQKDACAAYLANYNRPDFAITCTAMDMDAFKRWAKSSVAKPGEMFKSGTGGLKFVISLEKSELASSQAGKVASTAAASGASSPAARGPVSGTGSSYQAAVKPREKSQPVEGIKETLEDAQMDPEGSKAVRRDKETYHFNEPQRIVRPIEIPKDFKTDALEAKATEQRRADTEKFIIQNRGVTKNTVDPEDSKQVALKKASVTPIGGITPGGYKKVAEGKYVPLEAEKSGSGVQSFAVFHGGKVAAHKHDPDLTVLKVPKEKVDVLKKFRDQHGIQGTVGVGGKYALLTITPEEMAKLKAYQPKKKAPPKKKAEPEKPKVEPTIPVDGNTVHRLGEVSVLHDGDLEPPPVHAGVLQRGHKVVVNIAGTTSEATLAGYDRYGKPVVRVGDELHIMQWGQLKPAGAHAYEPAYAGLPDGALVKPSPKQKKLVDQVMGLNVVGKHSATEYTTWLRSKGQEVYLVGGIVRDLVAGTSPNSKMTDAEVLDTMKDVDIVSTAHPSLAHKMMQGVSPDVVNSGVTNDATQWGVLRSVGHGLGLDFSSMAARDGIFSDDPVWDHDLEEDTSRRDFTCNALYYDTHNNVIIDPTGVGIADAQNKVLRIAPSQEEAKLNSSLHIRFWKFRMRGYAPEKETLTFMKKQADHWWSKLKSKPHRVVKDIYKAIGKSGDPKKNLEDFRDVMEADGALDLYNKHIKPLEAQIIAYAKKKGPEG